ncbi:MAG: hypothetical protein J5950_07265 [Clostridia bacterium]|nr:hypothetical protein [Clostridia bacterium]
MAANCEHAANFRRMKFFALLTASPVGEKEWIVANCKLQMANGKLQMANGEWRIANAGIAFGDDYHKRKR